MSTEEETDAVREALGLEAAFEAAMGPDFRATDEFLSTGAALAVEVMREVYAKEIDAIEPATLRLATALAARKAAEEAGAPRIVLNDLDQKIQAADTAFRALPWHQEWKDRNIAQVMRAYIELRKIAATGVLPPGVTD